MKKEEAIQKAIEKTQNGCDLLFYPVVCESTVIDGVEEMSSALDNYQKKLAEHTDMWIICEMAKRWLEYLRDKKESKQEWIPCSERLPEIRFDLNSRTSDTVFVCLENRTMHMAFYCDDDVWRFCESGEAKEPMWNKVIAWMPLPERYGEEENK